MCVGGEGGGGWTATLFPEVTSSGIMPVAVGPPSGSVTLTTPQPSGNTLTQFFKWKGKWKVLTVSLFLDGLSLNLV